LPQENDTNLQEALLKQWARQVQYSPLPVILAMALIAYMASQYVAVWIWGSWLVLVIAAQILRWHIFLQLPVKTHIPVGKRIKTATMLNLIATISSNAALVWFPLFTPYQGAVQTLLLLTTMVTSALMGVGFTPFALSHIVFGLLPLFGLWAWSGLFGDGGVTALAVMVFWLCYCAFSFRLSGHIFQLYKESFDIRAQLEVALAAAEAAARAKTRFLASASHDLRQPIHALALFSAALSRRNLDDRSSQIVDSINTSVAALSYELDGLLDISKLDAGIVTVSRTNFCLVTLLRRLREEFSIPANRREIELLLECPERAIVNTDSTLLERVLRNLITNAIHHNTQCTLTLQLAQSGTSWQLVIADTGRGIAVDEQEKIFEEFYQLENQERDRNKGLGLGLSIVRRLSDLLDVRMVFSSAPGEGTQFKFTIPGIDQQQLDEPAVDHAQYSVESLVVLVVDDELTVREGMRVLLESLGCKVATAENSESAMAAAALQTPDIALVDLRLRNHDDGLKTIDRLRQLHPGLPAIIISGDTAPDRLLAISAAGIPVLTKPVMLDALREAIIRNCFPTL
jgi:signal transduction histidine kinase